MRTAQGEARHLGKWPVNIKTFLCQALLIFPHSCSHLSLARVAHDGQQVAGLGELGAEVTVGELCLVPPGHQEPGGRDPRLPSVISIQPRGRTGGALAQAKLQVPVFAFNCAVLEYKQLSL